jgi:cell division control protein 6
LFRRAVKGLHETTPVREDGVVVGIESEVISESVITACAEHAERERGSARQAIDLLGQAATIAHDERAQHVTIDHVETAQREVNKNYIKNMLDDHTADDILTLCGLLYLEARDQTPARTNQIHNYYATYATAVDETPLGQRRMRDRLQDLQLTGVISMKKVTGGHRGGERWESELSIPMDETIEILRHNDSYAPTYGRIIDEIAAEVQ